MNDLHILLVDDNETDQFFNETLIEDFDPEIKILQAYDGQEALNAIASAEQKPDVILLDINMPGMNGFEFLEEYSKNCDFSTVIVMLSSSDQGDDKQKALSYDCVKSYFVKPLDNEKIRTLIGLKKHT